MMASERPLQKFSDAYLERCRELSPEDIVRFLDDFRRLHGAATTRSRLVSLKVSEPLLAAFKAKGAAAQGALPNADQERHAGTAGGVVNAEGEFAHAPTPYHPRL